MANILVADENGNFRRTVKMLLSDCGHAVDEAIGADGAISLIGSRSYDVVLTEIDFAEGTGLEVLRALQDTCSQVIVVTASLSMETREVSLRLGVFDYFEKPCEPECLLRAVEDAARSRKPRKSLNPSWVSVA